MAGAIGAWYHRTMRRALAIVALVLACGAEDEPIQPIDVCGTALEYAKQWCEDERESRDACHDMHWPYQGEYCAAEGSALDECRELWAEAAREECRENGSPDENCDPEYLPVVVANCPADPAFFDCVWSLQECRAQAAAVE